VHRALFELELNEWEANRASWPADRSLAAFKDWFDYEIVESVADLGTGTIEDDDLYPAKGIDIRFAAAAGLPVRIGRTSAAEPGLGMDREIGICSWNCLRFSSRTARPEEPPLIS